MKKPKHPSIWEEDEAVFAEEGGSPMDHILDDEIIDLEDIVELPDDEQDQEEPLNVDVEILDLDSDMDFDDMEASGGAGKKGKAGRDEKKGKARSAKDLPDSDLMEDTDLLEKDSNDVLLDFSFPDEDEERSGKDELDLLSEDGDDVSVDFALPGDEPETKGPRKDKDLSLGDLDEDLADFSFPEEGKEEELKGGPSFLDKMDKRRDKGVTEFSLAEDQPGKAKSDAPPKAPKMGSAAAGMESLLDLQDEIASKKGAGVKDSLKKEAEQGMTGALAESPEALDSALERFVSQIEIRLVESLREIVEARLPEVVRAVLREEINKIKKETA